MTVRKRWRELMMQYIRTTIVSQTSSGIAPIIPILLCARLCENSQPEF